MSSPWEVVVKGIDPQEEPRRETLFGVGNGMMFVRGCAPEADAAQPADDTHYAGFYRAGGYNRPLRMANGEPARIAALVNLPQPFSLSFRADAGEWFSASNTERLDYVQRLDMQRGVAERSFIARDAQGRETRVQETRLASMADADLGLLCWTLTPLNWSGPLQARSRLSLRVVNAKIESSRAYEGKHLTVDALSSQAGSALVVRTTDGKRVFHLRSQLYARADVETPALAATDMGQGEDALWQTITVEVCAGSPCELSVWVRLNDQIPDPSRNDADTGDITKAIAAHTDAWRSMWASVQLAMPRYEDIERACRFSAFQLLQTRSPLSVDLDAGMPARGWQEGYLGQIFWDELLASGFLSTRTPAISRALLKYRHRRLPAARDAAGREGLAGAMFPWRSATTGEEETPPFQWIPPAKQWKRDHTYLQRHVGSAIAFNAWHHFCATGDEAYLADEGGELIVEIARFWCSVAQPGPSGRLEIRGVIGPDEYHDAYVGSDSPGLDNNAYTNVMAAWTLRCAAALHCHLSPARWAQLRQRLAICDDEIQHWDASSRSIKLPLLAGDVIAQFDGYDKLEPADSPALAGRQPHERADWWMLAHGDDINRYQLTKQADVLVLCHLFGPDGLQDLVAHLGYRLDDGWYARTVAYYLGNMSHESSLSRPICAGALAGIDAGASWPHFLESMQSDFGGKASDSTHQGVHLAAMAGGWDVLQRWYLGLRPHAWGLLVSPNPPPELDDVRMAVCLRGLWLDVHLSGKTLLIDARSGGLSSLAVEWRGQKHVLAPGGRLVFPFR
jgi:trehalose/maltose hydrolase-like predicted phosphorylase